MSAYSGSLRSKAIRHKELCGLRRLEPSVRRIQRFRDGHKKTRGYNRNAYRGPAGRTGAVGAAGPHDQPDRGRNWDGRSLVHILPHLSGRGK
jgi:hypothetical protein